MNKITLLTLLFLAFLFIACGEETTENITQVNQMAMEVVSSAKNLPKCTKDNEGEQAFVKGEKSARVCVDGEWISAAGDYSCTTKELKDKSGVKIICGGDSVGVVLNGKNGTNGKDGKDGATGEAGKDGKNGSGCSVVTLADKSGLKVICGGDSVGVVLNGKQGEQGLQGEKGDPGKQGEKGDPGKDGNDGAGCSVASQTDSTVTIKCGADSFTMSLRGSNGNGSSDTSGIDTSGVYEIENASISGVSQKGPFVKGASVTAFELDGSKSLLQTGRTFSGTISQDDGRFNMSNVTLKSSYVRLSANGYYRNEVTGERSVSPITLNAVTDLYARNTVNVNLLTHLEYDRVAELLRKGGGTLNIKKVKKQAEKEIFNAFHIDATGFGYSEDLDVFGKTEADAALLAISILLQGDRSEAELTELLTDFSTDFSTDSSWDDLAKRAEIADSALSKDAQGKFATYRSNVEGWGLSTGFVPHFEKYIRRFVSVENGLGVCGDDVAVGTVKNVSNKNSKKYYATTYTDVSNTAVRFICANADSAKWRVATDIEKDTMDWAKEFKNAKDGDVHNGKVNTNKTYVYENKNWRKGTDVDSLIGKGCVTFRQDTVALAPNKNWYKCVNQTWRAATDIEKDTATWGHKFVEGTVRNGRVNSNLTYVYQNNNWRLGTDLDSLLVKAEGKACLINGDTSTVKYNDVYYVCTAQPSGNVPRKWVVAPDIYNDTYESRDGCSKNGKYGDGTILVGRVNKEKKYVCDNGEFRMADSTEISWNRGCNSYIYGASMMFDGQKSYDKCSEKGWEYDFENLNKGTIKYGGKTYKTIGIRTQIWMAENLNYEVDGQSFCYNNSADSCAKYGRLYTWAAAVGKSEEDCGYGKTCGLSGKVRGVCPEGWHLPNRNEWNILYSAIGNSPYAMQAKGVADWPDATDAYGFSALPAGYGHLGSFYSIGTSALFWSSTEGIAGANDWIVSVSKAFFNDNETKNYGISVRCVKD
ncbi:FISUMP domain-containing protein [Fibrobacter sp.]|uniref:fibrobacter succinogenes major paralogous domain-containing protein n=1 Tax=Fibrobacter sp. TaxID=35828 RepID=UPI0025BB3B72|nr:FISUMP domain-containing protein [Fibrobacter sp.]MBR3072828.1 hypothetical protein [Fibrobacter sp.]